jgi:hypothetical protein
LRRLDAISFPSPFFYLVDYLSRLFVRKPDARVSLIHMEAKTRLCFHDISLKTGPRRRDRKKEVRRSQK